MENWLWRGPEDEACELTSTGTAVGLHVGDSLVWKVGSLSILSRVTLVSFFWRGTFDDCDANG